ncbi:MAG: hypothetical protein JW957_00870 [Candidatus Omnitrophica bacterium]|nr:hypothetical protein [Candidatus Omnitrophota bacterium]
MKISIVFFSLSGRTKRLSELIAGYLKSEGIDADVFCLETKETGRFIKNCMDAFRKKQVKLENMPQIAGSEFVLLGSPVWAFDIAPAMRSFLANAGLDGKKVFLFTTYGSGKGKENAMKTFSGLVKNKGGVVIGSADAKGRKVNEEFPLLKGVLEECLKRYQLIKRPKQ